LRRLLIIWTTINVIVPVSVLVAVAVTHLELHAQSCSLYLTVLGMFAANVAAMLVQKMRRWPFAIMLLLNPFAVIMLGDISFVTGIPELPFLFNWVYSLVLERL